MTLVCRARQPGFTDPRAEPSVTRPSRFAAPYVDYVTAIALPSA